MSPRAASGGSAWTRRAAAVAALQKPFPAVFKDHFVNFEVINVVFVFLFCFEFVFLYKM